MGLVPQLLGACPSADWRPEGRRELGRQGSKKPGKSLGKWCGETEVVTRSVRPASHSFLLYDGHGANGSHASRPSGG